MQIWKMMFCELFIFIITISRYGYSTCMFTIFKFAKYYKILISCANNDQIPYFARFISLTSSQDKCFLSACVHHLFVGKTSRSKTLWEDAVSIMQTFTVYSPFGDSENSGKNLLKIGINYTDHH